MTQWVVIYLNRDCDYVVQEFHEEQQALDFINNEYSNRNVTGSSGWTLFKKV